jgi:hypothetical protein
MNKLQKHFGNIMPGMFAVGVSVFVCNAGVAQDVGTQTADETFFFEQIEPVLKRHCFECHSHASDEISGGLALDSQSGWSKGGDRGPAIHPGDAANSLLIKAVRKENETLQMPPEEKLSDDTVALLVAWINRGAADPRKTVKLPTTDGDPLDWWSLRPLFRPDVPQRRSGSPENQGGDENTGGPSALRSIDSFVLQKLNEAGITPAPAADRRTLIRRLYFDLHGLPPTSTEADAFVSDSDPNAYAKLVDRLLESPRYGERWARHWLDAVHFADSHGCEHDVLRPNAWRYRDYVIDSLNNDTPWPRFIREQLAADYFYPEDTNLTPALGFVSAGPLELSRAGTAPVTFDYLDRDDMVTQTMAVFASTTANCARCHDHKFDPITQEDYYSLQAVFAGVGKGDVDYDADSSVATARRQWDALIAAAKSGDPVVMTAPQNVEIVDQWEAKFGQQTATWEVLRPATFLSSDGSTLNRLDDNSVLASGVRPDRDTYTITAPTSLNRLTAIRLDVLADDSLPMLGPGRQDNGNLHLTEFSAVLFDAKTAEPSPLKIRKVVADWDQEGWTIAHTLDGDLKTAWGIFPKVGQSHHAVFELETPVDLSEGSNVVVVLQQLHGAGHLIGRVKLYATDADAAAAEVVPDEVAAGLKLPRTERSSQQQAAVAAYALQAHAAQQLAALPTMSSVYAVSASYSRANKQPNPMPPKVVHVLKRGDIHKPGSVAAPGALSSIEALSGRFALEDPDSEPARRAALAEWLTANDNPLTWRSVVNRVWAWHFGSGLCNTPNDFGRMGGIPSHPELLDWLSVWFRDDAHGSLKQLHRMILLSDAYQRRSTTTTLTDTDPQNRMLWRMNRHPLDAESFRDAVLQISGRIDLTMGGLGIQQFTQSKGAQSTPKLDYDAFDWSAPAAARRSIYRVVWRGIADPFMESLDFPDLGLLAPQRGNSVSALQALATFNNDFVLHHCQVLADKLTNEHPAIDDRIRHACRIIYLREPAEGEHQLLNEYANAHGLAATCRVLFNSNEFLFVD